MWMRLTWCGLAAAFAGAAYAETAVYDLNADTAKQWTGVKWSADDEALGPASNDAASLKLVDLPKHEAVRVRVVLMLRGFWDGEAFADAKRQVIGPDQWGMRLVGGPTLIHTTFSYDGDHLQSFPRPWRQPGVKRATGAAKHGHTAVDGKGHSYARYVLTCTLPHQARSLTLRCYGEGLDPDETWSLEQVRVETLDALPAVKPAEIAKLIDALHGDDAAASEAAAWQLAWAGDAAIGPLIASLGDASKVVVAAGDDSKRLLALVKQLDADAFEQREAAMAKLAKLDDANKRELKRLAEAMDLTYEQTWRLAEVLKGGTSGGGDGHRAHPPAPTAAAQQRARVLRVLELINSDAAAAARRKHGLPLATESLKPGAVFAGVCGQDGYPSYPMHMTITQVKGDEVHGEFRWKTLRDSRSKFKGVLDDNRLTFTEYELISGGGIVIPVNYRAVFVGDMISGCWFSESGDATLYGTLQQE